MSHAVGSTCPYANAAPSPLSLEPYHSLHSDGKQLIMSWLRRAHKGRDCDDRKSFEPFIFAWIGFNGWASCVTGEDHDGEIVRSLANCPSLRSRFSGLLAPDTDFRAAVDRFAELWPIFCAQDVHRKGYWGTKSKGRFEVVQEYLRDPDIHFVPSCVRYHEKRGESIPRDWSHSLHAIHRVRNNLFHGEKSAHEAMDARIVKCAFDVLIGFVTESEIIMPKDQLQR